MSIASFDSNIVIDALNGIDAARIEISRVETRWISRLTWIEVMSKVSDKTLAATEKMLSTFEIDEVSLAIAERAAALRNERRSLKLADAVILASAQMSGRTLVTRNTKDFPAAMPGIRVPYTV